MGKRRVSEHINEKQIVQFIRENQEKLYRVAYTYVKNADTSLDLVQDAIVKALQKKHTLKNEEYLKTWVYRILINECLMYIRRNKKMAYFVDYDECAEKVAIESKDETNLELNQALESLEPKLKTVIILRFYEELKIDEIAQITNSNISTVKSRLYKALKLLKQDLEEITND